MRFVATFSILLAPLFALGCSSEPAVEEAARDGAGMESGEPHDHPLEGDDAHSHGAAPHGGTIADWGGGAYHVEFTVDHDQQQAVVYVLGDDAKSPAPVAATEGTLLLSISEPAFQVELQADPQSGDPEGASSRFVGQHENLGKVQEFGGTISGEIDGTPYVAEFEEHANEDHAQ
ncbi:hypothetical protein [Candidatus Laterigemmans baculatus]|uniref:hypothetical protein n=1 Tax=Candidatus Laterigemmans baculatus TaxID=2770505 RepID=UPI0013DD456D|nr:hypothetical protein [Candidatus Laterigemmans baculatus]